MWSLNQRASMLELSTIIADSVRNSRVAVGPQFLMLIPSSILTSPIILAQKSDQGYNQILLKIRYERILSDVRPKGSMFVWSYQL